MTDRSPSDQLLGAVLVGGRSSRMGQPKSELIHPTQVTFQQFAVDRMATVCQEVCVCGGATSSNQPYHAIPDATQFLGPVSGVVSALTYAASKSLAGCFVTPVDMPLLTVRDLENIFTVWRQERKICCAVSATDHRLQPLVAIYPADVLAAVRELMSSDNRSLTHWLRSQQPVHLTLSDESCQNINTPDEYATWTRRSAE